MTAEHDALAIGQIGLGGITEIHRAGYELYSQPVVAGADPNAAARERFAADRTDAAVYERVEDLLADPAVGVIDLATPHHRNTRVPLMERIAASGKPVLIQKPLAMNYRDALEVTEICERSGVTAMVNQNMCFSPAALALERALLVDRAVGTPTYGQIQLQYRFDTDYHPWFGKDDRWWTIGLTVHHLGLLQLLFGPPASVYAMLGQDTGQPGVTKDGYGHLALTYPDGLQVLVVSTGTYYGTDSVRHGEEKVWVQGTEGIVDWSPHTSGTISRRGPAGIERTSLDPPFDGRWFPHAFGLTMAHFRDSVRLGLSPRCSVTDNLHVMAVVEAAYRSGAERRVVPTEEIMGGRYDPDYGSGWSHGAESWTPPHPVVPAGDAA